MNILDQIVAKKKIAIESKKSWHIFKGIARFN